uniref:Uncharacterized protein n=1 Tax=Chrysotila carterae TaxID=13221 RepID=A0A6S9TMT7_CHRCT
MVTASEPQQERKLAQTPRPLALMNRRSSDSENKEEEQAEVCSRLFESLKLVACGSDALAPLASVGLLRAWLSEANVEALMEVVGQQPLCLARPAAAALRILVERGAEHREALWRCLVQDVSLRGLISRLEDDEVSLSSMLYALRALAAAGVSPELEDELLGVRREERAATASELQQRQDALANALDASTRKEGGVEGAKDAGAPESSSGTNTRAVNAIARGGAGDAVEAASIMDAVQGEGENGLGCNGGAGFGAAGAGVPSSHDLERARADLEQAREAAQALAGPREFLWQQIGGQRLLAFACAPASSAPAAVELVATLCSAPANLHALLRRLSRSCLLASKRNGEEERSVLKRVSSVLAAVVSRSDVVTALVGAPVGIGGAVGAARGDGVAQAQLRTLVAAIDAHHTREGVGAFCMEPRLAVEIRRRQCAQQLALLHRRGHHKEAERLLEAERARLRRLRRRVRFLWRQLRVVYRFSRALWIDALAPTQQRASAARAALARVGARPDAGWGGASYTPFFLKK